jgi:hypothetical protein
MNGQDMTTLNDVASYEFTDDGGASWTQLNGTASIDSPATFDGATYAIQYPSLDKPGGIAHLAVSTDGMRSWAPIDNALVGAHQFAANFWVNTSGELLEEVKTETPISSPDATPTTVTIPTLQNTSVGLWRSSDGGAHWEQIQTPRLQSAPLQQDVVVQQPRAGDPWHICELSAYGATTLPSLACTFDGGHTWSARPLICPTSLCHSIASFALASDGAILDMDLAPGSDSQLGLYRLPQGSNTWQYLGPTSGSNAYFFAPASGGGILWAFAGGTYQGRLIGIIGGHQLLPGVVATATYP